MKKTVCMLVALLQLFLLTACSGQNALSEDAPETAPHLPDKTYITVQDKQMELLGSRELQAGYTQDNLVQFLDFFDFGLRDERPLGFSGKVYLNGTQLSSNEYRFDGYPDLTTIVLKLFQGHQLTGNTLTVEENSVIFYDREAIVIKTTFQAKWDGEKWTAV